MSMLILALGCAGTPQAEPETPTPPAVDAVAESVDKDAAAPAVAASVEPDAAAEAVYRALSVRDPAPSCEGVEALTETPLETLLFVVDNAQQPPWVGMRAAECLTSRHAEAAEASITAWVSSAETKGLAILALNQLDTMPLAVSLNVARAALAGPEADSARSRIERSTVAEIKALVE